MSLHPTESAAPKPVVLPEQFGPYRIVRPLGKGGMGSVYLARDSRLERDVALKVCHVADKPQMLERLRREARAAANLSHPNLCPVYEFDVRDGIAYITMGFIDGPTLDLWVRGNGPLSQRDAALLVAKLAAAMQEAHDAGVVHRDLKPANIVINKKGEPVILDFGLAHYLDNSGVRLTKVGAIMGTPSYMAPEQAGGDPARVGPPCDVYAMGVLLYELLTGSLPFRGPVHVVLAKKQHAAPEPLRQRNPSVDERLEAVCLRALAREPADRFATMSAFAAELTDAARTAPAEAPASAPVPEWLAEATAPYLTPEPAARATPPPLPPAAVTSAPLPAAPLTPPPPPPVSPAPPTVTPQVTPAAETLPAPVAATLPTSLVRPPVAPHRPPAAPPVKPAAALPVKPPAVRKRGRRSVFSASAEVWAALALVLLLSGVVALVVWRATKREAREVPEGPKRPAPPVHEPPTPPPEGMPLRDDDAPPTRPHRRIKPAAVVPSPLPPPYAGNVPDLPTPKGRPLLRPFLADPIVNSVGMELVHIPAGSFRMGSPETEHDRGEDESPHGVTLTKGFHLGATPVTQKQWKAVMGADSNPSEFKGDDLPVENVSWDDAREFCKKLSEKEGREYRLPTEAEWEYACRAGTTSPFWFGQTVSTDRANFDGRYPYREEETRGEFRNRTTPVTTFRANAFGLRDMHGNVWQWCEDWYEVYPKEDAVDPKNTTDGMVRVLRGGSWFSSARLCRAAYRGCMAPGHCGNTIGFRVVLSPE